MTNIFTKSAIALAMLGMATAATAKGYNEVEVTDGGTFIGTVTAGAAEADTRTYTISKDPEICGEGSREVPFVEINDAGMLMNAVVFLVDVEEDTFNKHLINNIVSKTEKFCTEFDIPESEIAHLLTVVYELSGNLLRYSQYGYLIVKALKEERRIGIQVISVDHGRGIKDEDLEITEENERLRWDDGTVSLGTTKKEGFERIRDNMDEVLVEGEENKGSRIVATKCYERV